MEVKTTVEKNGQYLHITSVGKREGYDAIVTGARSVYAAAKASKLNYVLMDCSELMYVNISYPDAFNLVRFYEQELPEFSNIVISTIGNPKSSEIMKFWESICIKRGCKCRVFSSEESAKDWLNSQIKLEEITELSRPK